MTQILNLLGSPSSLLIKPRWGIELKMLTRKIHNFWIQLSWRTSPTNFMNLSNKSERKNSNKEPALFGRPNRANTDFTKFQMTTTAGGMCRRGFRTSRKQITILTLIVFFRFIDKFSLVLSAVTLRNLRSLKRILTNENRLNKNSNWWVTVNLSI